MRAWSTSGRCTKPSNTPAGLVFPPSPAPPPMRPAMAGSALAIPDTAPPPPAAPAIAGIAPAIADTGLGAPPPPAGRPPPPARALPTPPIRAPPRHPHGPSAQPVAAPEMMPGRALLATGAIAFAALLKACPTSSKNPSMSAARIPLFHSTLSTSSTGSVANSGARAPRMSGYGSYSGRYWRRIEPGLKTFIRAAFMLSSLSGRCYQPRRCAQEQSLPDSAVRLLRRPQTSRPHHSR